MPTMYRIGCLRDDVIFFIYLYQRYIYRIDPTRVNEFGYSAEMLDDDKKGSTNPTNSGDAKIKSSSEEKAEIKSVSKPGSPSSSTKTKSKPKKQKKKDQ
jgi:hypothetical protein